VSKYFVNGLSKKQIEAFEKIAIGEYHRINRQTAVSLIKRGLITEDWESCGMHVIVYRYYVPIPIHAAWCEWCSENVEE
jgi:hypothetical protein